ncbi:MAG TPA: hypothetical protein VLA95_00645 [Gemmatimonadales bacterium]|nr:hypothetical protein [Gemmatimonadales bacterium]
MPACLAAALLAACSDLSSSEGGVVALEVVRPAVTQLEVGDSLQMLARALDAEGEELPEAEIWWTTPDTTVRVDSASGWVVPLRAGLSGRVLARSGSLISGLTTFNFLARADTLIREYPADTTLPVGVTASGPLAVRLESFDPPGPLSGRSLVFEIVEPVFADPDLRTVELSTGALLDTLTTGSTGGPASPVELRVAEGQPAPDSAVVEFRSSRFRGAEPVPGSGQRTIIRFTPQP